MGGGGKEGGKLREGAKHSLGLPASLAPLEMSNNIEIATSTMHMATSLLLHTPSRRTLPTDSTQPAPPNLRSTTWEWWCCCHLFPSSATSSAPGFFFFFYSLFFIIYSSFLLIATFFATWASVLHAIIIIRRRHWGRRSRCNPVSLGFGGLRVVGLGNLLRIWGIGGVCCSMDW